MSRRPDADARQQLAWEIFGAQYDALTGPDTRAHPGWQDAAFRARNAERTAMEDAALRQDAMVRAARDWCYRHYPEHYTRPGVLAERDALRAHLWP